MTDKSRSKITRRQILKTVTPAVGGASIAGCLSPVTSAIGGKHVAGIHWATLSDDVIADRAFYVQNRRFLREDTDKETYVRVDGMRDYDSPVTRGQTVEVVYDRDRRFEEPLTIFEYTIPDRRGIDEVLAGPVEVYHHGDSEWSARPTDQGTGAEFDTNVAQYPVVLGRKPADTAEPRYRDPAERTWWAWDVPSRHRDGLRTAAAENGVEQVVFRDRSEKATFSTPTRDFGIFSMIILSDPPTDESEAREMFDTNDSVGWAQEHPIPLTWKDRIEPTVIWTPASDSDRNESSLSLGLRTTAPYSNYVFRRDEFAAIRVIVNDSRVIPWIADGDARAGSFPVYPEDGPGYKLRVTGVKPGDQVRVEIEARDGRVRDVLRMTLQSEGCTFDECPAMIPTCDRCY